MNEANNNIINSYDVQPTNNSHNSGGSDNGSGNNTTVQVALPTN